MHEAPCELFLKSRVSYAVPAERQEPGELQNLHRVAGKVTQLAECLPGVQELGSIPSTTETPQWYKPVNFSTQKVERGGSEVQSHPDYIMNLRQA